MLILLGSDEIYDDRRKMKLNERYNLFVSGSIYYGYGLERTEVDDV